MAVDSKGGGKRNDAHARTRVQREWSVLSSLPPSLLFSLSHMMAMLGLYLGDDVAPLPAPVPPLPPPPPPA